MAKVKKTLSDLINPETETVSAPSTPQIVNVLLKEIYPSDTNPRKTMDEDAIIDLAKSMHDVGLLQPITVRPDSIGKFEIVAGHRRFKAAEQLKWHSIPAIIREVGDDEVLEIQIIENLQREDVSPMDEAAAFKSILQRESFDWLCSRIHKSKKYITDRLKLNDLEEEGQEYVHSGILPLTHAIMISKLPIDEQKKCIEKCIDEDWNIDPNKKKKFCKLTTNQLREYIEDDLMIDLDKACFDLEDADLLPAAGSCATCPKRTCNQNLLFEEITDDDKCTDAACYHSKETAHVDATLKKAKEDHGKDSVFAGQTQPYSNSTIKVKGVEVPFVDKKVKGKDQVCVVVTKSEGFSSKKNKLGKTVWVDREELEVKVKEKEDRKTTSKNSGNRSNGNNAWLDQKKSEFNDIIHPRLNIIASLLEGDSITNSEAIAINYIRRRFDLITARDVIALASILGLYHIDDDKLWNADDDIDREVEIGIIDKIIAHIQGKGFVVIVSVLALLETIDEIEEVRSAEEKADEETVDMNWNELMELIRGKSKPAKKNAKKASS
jgi:ParB/RepB/Spo0J family partition protein